MSKRRAAREAKHAPCLCSPMGTLPWGPQEQRPSCSRYYSWALRERWGRQCGCSSQQEPFGCEFRLWSREAHQGPQLRRVNWGLPGQSPHSPMAQTLALDSNYSTTSLLLSPPSWGMGRMQVPLQTEVSGQPAPLPSVHPLRLEPTLGAGPAVLALLDVPKHPPPGFSWRGDQAPPQPLVSLISALRAEPKQKCPRSPTTSTSKRKLSPRPAQEGGPNVALV